MPHTSYNPPRPEAVSFARLAGAALGTMCGDALGMPVEGWSAAAIAQAHGRLERMLPGRLPAGHYTDDSQMMVAILESLAAKGRLQPDHLAQRFLARFEPKRGYGGRIFGVMRRIAEGQPWDQVGTDSFGNGGAMRVGVVGAFFADDDQAIGRAALDQCRITHHHPQGLAGAAAMALAVGLAARLGAAGRPHQGAGMVEYLVDMVRPLDEHSASRLARLAALRLDRPGDLRRALTAEFACDVTAAESVPPAIGAFLGSRSAAEAIVLAVSLGGDTDTIGAMAGALAGAYWGVDTLPSSWLEALENQETGRDYVLGLCRRALAAKSTLTKSHWPDTSSGFVQRAASSTGRATDS